MAGVTGSVHELSDANTKSVFYQNAFKSMGKQIKPGTMKDKMGINNFISQVQEFVRPSMFYVEMTGFGAKGGSGNATTFNGELGYYCNATTIPASTINAVDVPFMGRSIKVAGQRTFSDWSITVYNDIEYKIRNFFETWMARINGHNSNIGYNRIEDYFGRADVLQLDQAGNTLSTYKMSGVFPTSVGEVSLSWGDANSVSSFNVSLAIGNFWTSTASEEVDTNYGVSSMAY